MILDEETLLSKMIRGAAVQHSPYTPGQVAREVPGREQQLADYELQLTLLADTRRLIGRIRVELGARGYGKTSLLRQVQQRTDGRNIETVWVTAGEGVGLVAAVAAEIRRVASSWPERSARSLTRMLDSLDIAVGVPGVVKFDAKLSKAREDTTSRGLQKLISFATHHALDAGKLGLVLFIDEVQSADVAGVRALGYAMQHLQSEEPSLPFAVFTAGLPNTPEAIVKRVTFSERFEYRDLPSLSDDAETIALVVPASILNVRWNEDAIVAAKEIARGYPYYLQLIANGAWVAAGHPDAGSWITRADVEAGREIMERDMRSLFEARWSTATEAERRFMAGMAHIAAEAGDLETPVDRSAVTVWVRGDERGDVSQLRAGLINKGFIRAAGRAKIEFTVPWFAEYVLDATGD